jgi:hypothetical protein
MCKKITKRLMEENDLSISHEKRKLNQNKNKSQGLDEL